MTGPSDSPQSLEPPPAPRHGRDGKPSGPLSLPRIGLLTAWLAVAAAHLLQGPETRLQTWPLGYLFLEALACASLAFRATRSTGKAARAWWLLATSAFLEVPNLLVTYLHLQGSLPARWAEVASLLSLATGILVLWGVLSFPKGQERAGMFRRRALDSLIFATSLLFLLWVMGVQASLRTADHGVGLRVFAAYLNVALLGGGLVFMTSYHPDRIRGPLGWLAVSALAWLLALASWTLAGLPSVVATERWIIVAGAIPLFQGFAAWSPRSVEEALVGADPERRVAGLLPYLPVIISVAVLAALLAWGPAAVTREAFALFLAVVVLLLLRQFQAIQDLQAARRTLEVRVVERTQALERAQDTLLRTERMNSLALMGAGLAHDLNNLLSAIRSSADLAVLTLNKGLPPQVQDLIRIATAADSATQLTRRLMAFARRESEVLAPMDLGREVREMEVTLRLLVPRSVALRIEVAPGDPLTVWSSRLRLEQMLVNLVANAGDAMPGGGTLAIRVRRDGRESGLAVIEVQDSGTGMAPDVVARIFDPFFTTKAPGKGTGLGLSSLKAMLDESGGRLVVESEPGKGSCFRILLPQLSQAEVSLH